MWVNGENEGPVEPERLCAALAEASLTLHSALLVSTVPHVGDWHSHPTMELVYSEDGHGEYELEDGRRVAFEPGSLAILPGARTHRATCRDRSRHHCLLIGGVPPLANRMAYLPPPIPEALVREFCALVSTPLPGMVRAGFDVGPGTGGGSGAGAAGSGPVTGGLGDAWQRLALNHRAAAMLATLLERAVAAGAMGTAERSLAATYVAQAEACLAAEFATIRHLEEVAARVGIGLDHLRQVFRQATGRSLKAALDEHRLQHAKLLLRHTGLPLKAVATASGFAHDRHLCARFRAATGETPGAYRRRRQRG